jgi:hypothetical protein
MQLRKPTVSICKQDSQQCNMIVNYFLMDNIKLNKGPVGYKLKHIEEEAVLANLKVHIWNPPVRTAGSH